MLLLLAQAEDVATGSTLGAMLPLVLIGLFIWFAMIRPQRKRQQASRQMQSALAVGDRIVTIGGLHGEVDAIGDDSVDIVVDADGDVVLRFRRSSIAEIVRDGDDAEVTPGGKETTE